MKLSLSTFTVLIFVIAVSAGCDGHRSDKAMMDKFQTHSKSLERLREIIAEGGSPTYIRADGSSRDSAKLAPDRTQECRRLLTEIGAVSLAYSTNTSTAIRIVMSEEHHGLGLDASVKGCVWLAEPPIRTAKDLNSIPPDFPETYRHIHGNWYLFAVRFD